MRVATACGVALAVVSVPVGPAWADGGADAGRIRAASAEYDAGRRAFKAGEFESAGDHFESANRDAPAPEALRGAIKSRVSARQNARAATLAAIADVKYPSDKPTAALVQQTLQSLEKSLHRVAVHCSTPCTVLVDGKLSPWLETSEAIVYADPGNHEVVAGFGERASKSVKIVASAGGRSDLSFEPPPPEPTEVTKPADKPKDEPPVDRAKDERFTLPKPVFYGLAGVTVVLAGVTIWSGVDMRSSPGKAKVREDCAGQPASCPTYQTALGKQTRTNVLLVSSLVGAAATGVVGIFLTDWSDPPEKKPDATARLAPFVTTDHGVTLGAAGTF